MTISYNLNQKELKILSEHFTLNGISRPTDVFEERLNRSILTAWVKEYSPDHN